MSLSEIITILIAFHQSGMACFKYFYLELMRNYRNLFNYLVHYDRFVALIKLAFPTVVNYYKNKPLFENICLKIPSGQKVGLVGYSGSGKSTFVNLILRVFDPKDVRIIIDNQEIKEVSQVSLRRAIGIISQDPLLFHRTVAENIRYGKEDASDEEIIKIAKQNLSSCNKSLEKGLERYEIINYYFDSKKYRANLGLDNMTQS